MRYCGMVPGVFHARPNRFIAHIEIKGQLEVCHVKNTGRCRELLPPGARVWCQISDKPQRKTRFDLIAVEKGQRLINMDSQAPNKAVAEWLQGGGLGPIEELRPETVHGNSRFDFSFRKDGRLCFLEVKGVTLEQDGVCAFPDAPTLRGTKHLRELAQAAQEGFGAYVLFVIQMSDVSYLLPNDATDPAFGKALREAQEQGVTLLAMDCLVTPNELCLRKPVPICLPLARSPRLLIRRMRPDDLAPLTRLLSDPEVMRFLEPPYTPAQAEAFLQSAGLCPKPLVYAVEDPKNAFIGYVIFHSYSPDTVELGWVLAPQAWHRGYAHELTKMLLEQARSIAKYAVIECVPQQTVSRHIAEKNGFAFWHHADGCDVYRISL